MEKIRLNLDRRIDDSYDIIIGKDILKNLIPGIKKLSFSKIAIITDTNVKKLYAQNFHDTAKKAGINTLLINFPAGEKSKNRRTKERIEDALVTSGLDRNAVIIAFGGGVVGDMAGYIASTYMRGLPYLQVPTSLLAMVDSSIGGKTAINTKDAKNLIGTFYQPKQVLIDISVLSTLPKDEFLNGVAEMIKHAIILDKKYFVYLEDYLEKIMEKEENSLIKSIGWSCTLKKEIIEKDEKEKSLRQILNFGHTIGHAIEKSSNFTVQHGKAVALGILVESKMAQELGLLNQFEYEKISTLLKKAGFPLKLPVSKKEIIENTKYDKKKLGSRIRYVLPKGIGNAQLDIEVSKEVLSKVLGDLS